MTLPTLFIILTLLATHWLADFVFQSDFMAKNKSTSITILFIHTTTYIFVFLPVLLALLGPSTGLILFLLFNWLAHTLVDFITSRITSVLYKAGDTHQFFTVIGFDQFIHAATLITTAYYFHLL